MAMNSSQVDALLNGPAMRPPTGEAVNFINPPNLQPYYILTLVLCMIISTFAIVMRVYTKVFILKKFGREDYTSVLGYFMWVGYCVPTGLIMKNGGGYHQWDVQLKTLINLLYYANIAAILYGITVFIIKLSILLQYLRIFVPRGQRNFLWWGVYTVIAINFLFYTAITFGEIFICSPREKFWNVLITTGHCFDSNKANIAAGAVNSFSDFVVLLLPQGAIWKLQLPLKRKIGVSAIFMIGFFVCITSVLRLYYAVRLSQTGDVSYNIAPMGFWTYAELSAGVVCGCLPVSPKFFQTMGEKLASLSQSKTGSSMRSMLRSFKRGRSSLGSKGLGSHGSSNSSGSWNNSSHPYSPSSARPPVPGRANVCERCLGEMAANKLDARVMDKEFVGKEASQIWREVRIESSVRSPTSPRTGPTPRELERQ